MRAGALRHSVTVERPVQTQNEFGEMVEAWETVDTIPADVQQLRGQNYFLGGQQDSAIVARARLRYRDDLSTVMRLVFEGRTYSVESIIDVGGRHAELELMLAEGVPNA